MAPKESRVYWLWAVIPVIAVFELFFQWIIPLGEPSVSDWKSAVELVAKEKRRHDLVTIAPDWESPTARMHLGPLITRRDFGRFDTSRYDRIFEISANSARSPESQGLIADMEQKFGRLTVSRYTLKHERSQVVYDFFTHLGKAVVAGTKRLGRGFIIDHGFAPRFVIRVPLTRRGVSVTYTDVPLNGVVRGYGIVDYKNGKFNSGGPVRLSVSVNGFQIGETMIHNHDVNQPFEFSLPGDGLGTVRFEISAQDYLKREFGFTADVRERVGGTK
ncbi:MAG: hypothetical protein GY762_10230 [Proteobacteria bacterium]|nr:hypothetical protein [Pseudomonadota bacterium]